MEKLIVNPSLLCDTLDVIEEWLSDVEDCWRYEPDDFSYSYGSESGIHFAGHYEFDQPEPLVIRIDGAMPFHSVCIDEMVTADGFISALNLSELNPTGLKLTGDYADGILTIKLTD